MAVLPKPLQRFTTDGLRVMPQYVKPTNAVYQLEEQILDCYRYSLDDSYENLMDQLEPMCQASQRHKLIRGFMHLLDKRLSYADLSIEDPIGLRLELFRRAARVPASDFAKKSWRDDIIKEVAKQFEVDPNKMDELLYADLKDQRKISAFDDLDADELLAEYNLALAQSLLLYARSLEFTINISPKEANALRRLFRHLRFFNLLFEVKHLTETSWQFKVDGPSAVLPQPQKYGLELASFLRTLYEFSDWAATASIDLEQNGKTKLWELKPGDFDAPHKQIFERIPEEANKLIERLRETAPELEIIDTPSILNFSNQAVWIPDFSAKIRATGAIAHVEVLGFWRADYLNRRLKALTKAPKNLILVLSEKLKVDKTALADTKIPIVTYKTTPLPKNVQQAILLYAKN